MPNGMYGRAVPRLALAVAEYRSRYGDWPTHAHGSGVMAILDEPGPLSEPDHHREFRADFAQRVAQRLVCDRDGGWIVVSGPAGACGYGAGPDIKSTEFREAYRWLYGEDWPL